MIPDCIEFKGARTTCGYGKVGTTRYGTRLAHRVAWINVHGPIPEGMLVCHTCDNPPCINLEHLFLGTPKDNSRDRDKKGRAARHDGQHNGRHKLSQEDVETIRASKGILSGSVLALIYGIKLTHVGRIQLGRAWR